MNAIHPDDDTLVACALDELEARDRAAIEAHLAVCETCRGIEGRMRAALDAYRMSEPAEAPARVLADLLETQAALRARRAGWSRRLRPVFVTAALVVFAGIFASGFWMGRSTAPAPAVAAAPVKAGMNRAPEPRPLPARPAIDFRTEPPLEIRFALAAETSFTGVPGRPGSRDSL